MPPSPDASLARHPHPRRHPPPVPVPRMPRLPHLGGISADSGTSPATASRSAPAPRPPRHQLALHQQPSGLPALPPAPRAQHQRLRPRRPPPRRLPHRRLRPIRQANRTHRAQQKPNSPAAATTQAAEGATTAPSPGQSDSTQTPGTERVQRSHAEPKAPPTARSPQCAPPLPALPLSRIGQRLRPHQATTTRQTRQRSSPAGPRQPPTRYKQQMRSRLRRPLPRRPHRQQPRPQPRQASMPG